MKYLWEHFCEEYPIGENEPLSSYLKRFYEWLETPEDQVERTLQSFFYELARDHLTPGHINRLIRDASPNTKYSDEYLAAWAKDAAARLMTAGK